MFKWTTLMWTGLAGCFLTLTTVNAGTDMGCLPPPPPPQDYLKKTVRVEIKGQLLHIQNHWEGPRDPQYPMPNVIFIDFWKIDAGGKSYQLQFGERKDITDLANKLAGKTVIVTGTLEGNVVQLTGLKADDEYVKETTEIEARGQLSAIYLETVQPRNPNDPVLMRLDRFPRVIAWNFVVDGKTYTVNFATAELSDLARKLDGKAVILTGVLDKDTIIVKTLKAAE